MLYFRTNLDTDTNHVDSNSSLEKTNYGNDSPEDVGQQRKGRPALSEQE